LVVLADRGKVEVQIDEDAAFESVAIHDEYNARGIRKCRNGSPGARPETARRRYEGWCSRPCGLLSLRRPNKSSR
jgi:hypothetical protein